MVLADVLLGYFISRVLDKKSPTARPPIVVTPTTPTTPTYVPTTPTTPTTPTYVPPTPTPTVMPTTPTFPSNQVVPPTPTTPTAGMKKAVEVWVIKPGLQTTIVGMGIDGASSVTALEASFPQGWQAATRVTTAEINTAKSLLPKWKDGGVIFMGPTTTAGRRAYRMTKHPATAAQPAAVPVAPTTPAVTPAPTPAPSGIVPASYTPPAATPAPTAAPAAAKPPTAAPTPPQAKPPVAAPATAAPVAPVGQQITSVRRGEGLAQISKRLGMGETAAGAITIQKANVPNGPDAKWQATDLRKGGLKKVGRSGGLQPGDKLFVPPTWGPYDAKRL